MPLAIPASSMQRGQGGNRSSSIIIEIGSRRALDEVGELPELLEIDREINRPYMTDPPLFNSQAWSRRLEIPWVIKEVGEPEGLSILDVGSGTSALPVFLGRRGARVVSVDPEVFHGLPGDMTVRAVAALPRLPFKDASFDIVCCISVLEHLPLDIGLHFAELCRVARRKVIITFDVALSPLAVLGLSSVELKALSRALGKRIVFPKEMLKPAEPERRICVIELGVCMMAVEKTGGAWPSVRLSEFERRLVRLHRKVQKWAGKARQNWLRIRNRFARGQTAKLSSALSPP